MLLSVKLLLQSEKGIEVISLALILLLASVPIAMQVMFVSPMAVGARKLAKRNVLICKLPTIEELTTMLL